VIGKDETLHGYELGEDRIGNRISPGRHGDTERKRRVGRERQPVSPLQKLRRLLQKQIELVMMHPVAGLAPLSDGNVASRSRVDRFRTPEQSFPVPRRSAWARCSDVRFPTYRPGCAEGGDWRGIVIKLTGKAAVRIPGRCRAGEVARGATSSLRCGLASFMRGHGGVQAGIRCALALIDVAAGLQPQ